MGFKDLVKTAQPWAVGEQCKELNHVATGVTGSLTYKCSKHGVEYIQSDSGIAVSLDRDGKPVKCED